MLHPARQSAPEPRESFSHLQTPGGGVGRGRKSLERHGVFLGGAGGLGLDGGEGGGALQKGPRALSLLTAKRAGEGEVFGGGRGIGGSGSGLGGGQVRGVRGGEEQALTS